MQPVSKFGSLYHYPQSKLSNIFIETSSSYPPRGLSNMSLFPLHNPPFHISIPVTPLPAWFRPSVPANPTNISLHIPPRPQMLHDRCIILHSNPSIHSTSIHPHNQYSRLPNVIGTHPEKLDVGVQDRADEIV